MQIAIAKLESFTYSLIKYKLCTISNEVFMADVQGRPTLYTDELAEEICEVVANSAKGLEPLCRENKHWPHVATIRRWIQHKVSFCDKYAQAKLVQADVLAEECLEIADDSSRDTIIKKTQAGQEYEVCDNEWVQRSRLRIDTRKWLAAKLAPRIYGDKLEKSSPEAQSLLQNIIDKL